MLSIAVSIIFLHLRSKGNRTPSEPVKVRHWMPSVFPVGVLQAMRGHDLNPDVFRNPEAVFPEFGEALPVRCLDITGLLKYNDPFR